MVVVPTVVYGKFVAYGCKPQEKHMNLPILYPPSKWWETCNRLLGTDFKEMVNSIGFYICNLYSVLKHYYVIVNGVTYMEVKLIFM